MIENLKALIAEHKVNIIIGVVSFIAGAILL